MKSTICCSHFSMSAAIIQVKEAQRRRMLLKHKVCNFIIPLIVHNLHVRFLNFILIWSCILLQRSFYITMPGLYMSISIKDNFRILIPKQSKYIVDSVLQRLYSGSFQFLNPGWYLQFLEIRQFSNIGFLSLVFVHLQWIFLCFVQQLDIPGFLSWKMEGWWLMSSTFLSQLISHLATLATRSLGWAGYRTLRLLSQFLQKTLKTN